MKHESSNSFYELALGNERFKLSLIAPSTLEDLAIKREKAIEDIVQTARLNKTGLPLPEQYVLPELMEKVIVENCMDEKEKERFKNWADDADNYLTLIQHVGEVEVYLGFRFKDKQGNYERRVTEAYDSHTQTLTLTLHDKQDAKTAQPEVRSFTFQKNKSRKALTDFMKTISINLPTAIHSGIETLLSQEERKAAKAFLHEYPVFISMFKDAVEDAFGFGESSRSFFTKLKV